MARNRYLEHRTTDLLLETECNIGDIQLSMMNLLDGDVDKKNSLSILINQLERGLKNKLSLIDSRERLKEMCDEELEAVTKRFLQLDEPAPTTN